MFACSTSVRNWKISCCRGEAAAGPWHCSAGRRRRAGRRRQCHGGPPRLRVPPTPPPGGGPGVMGHDGCAMGQRPAAAAQPERVLRARACRGPSTLALRRGGRACGGKVRDRPAAPASRLLRRDSRAREQTCSVCRAKRKSRFVTIIGEKRMTC